MINLVAADICRQYCNIMDLEDYFNDDEHQEIITLATLRKEEIEQQKQDEEREFHLKVILLKDCFLRFSCNNKKKYILSIIEQTQHECVLDKVFYYVSMSFDKVQMYSRVNPFRKFPYQQVLIDHDRSLYKPLLQDIFPENLNWILNLNEERQFRVLVDFLLLSGGGLVTQLYWEISKTYCRRKLELQKRKNNEDSGNIFDDTELDDTDRYPQEHELSIEVEKMRKNWNEMMEKYRKEVIGDEETLSKKNTTKESNQKKTKDTKKKAKTTNKSSKTANGKKSKSPSDSQDWLQLLPIWIVKKIFHYLDQKTLQATVKKVNHYWDYASDSVLKERQCRKLLDQAIEKMMKDIDFGLLETTTVTKDIKMPTCTFREKKLYHLMNRGAVSPSLIPKGLKSNQMESSLLTSLPNQTDSTVLNLLNKTVPFPRFTTKALPLYNDYDLEKDEEEQPSDSTPSYNHSCEMSDLFSLSNISISDW